MEHKSPSSKIEKLFSMLSTSPPSETHHPHPSTSPSSTSSTSSTSNTTFKDPTCPEQANSTGSSHRTAPIPYTLPKGTYSARTPCMEKNTRYIKLNIGGAEFITTTETLCKEESMLSAMVRHHFAATTEAINSQLRNSKFSDLQNQEELFIDRDGEYFPDILSFLRNGVLDPIPDSEKKWKGLLREADFYGLTSLIEVLHNIHTKHKYKFYVLIKGSSFNNCQVYPPPKSYEKRHSNPVNMVSCLNAHLRDGFEIEEITWPTVSSDACQAILVKRLQE
eukprot:TRINITY_DN12806_c0_g1_i1.p1 TRINITY_DN12806_c0_g1~~TRINITY_DN12806_c0_g1_i1.p1  ORF type:complete len:297 (-),score=63.59 TRINITY_DN12806_c0_g1_i1:48-881(-)